MAQGTGSGWHGQSRKHADAASLGHRSRGSSRPRSGSVSPSRTRTKKKTFSGMMEGKKKFKVGDKVNIGDAPVAILGTVVAKHGELYDVKLDTGGILERVPSHRISRQENNPSSKKVGKNPEIQRHRGLEVGDYVFIRWGADKGKRGTILKFEKIRKGPERGLILAKLEQVSTKIRFYSLADKLAIIEGLNIPKNPSSSEIPGWIKDKKIPDTWQKDLQIRGFKPFIQVQETIFKRIPRGVEQTDKTFYNVEYVQFHGQRTLKQFERKSAAREFAIKWMREHPRG